MPANLSSLVGVYTLKLKVHLVNFPTQQAEREFLVEVIDPCLTASFQIDQANSVLAAPPANTVLQFVSYPATGISWNSSTFVSKSLPPANDPCGQHTLELWQLDGSGAEISLDETIFTTNAPAALT